MINGHDFAGRSEPFALPFRCLRRSGAREGGCSFPELRNTSGAEEGGVEHVQEDSLARRVQVPGRRLLRTQGFFSTSTWPAFRCRSWARTLRRRPEVSGARSMSRRFSSSLSSTPVSFESGKVGPSSEGRRPCVNSCDPAPVAPEKTWGIILPKLSRELHGEPINLGRYRQDRDPSLQHSSHN